MGRLSGEQFFFIVIELSLVLSLGALSVHMLYSGFLGNFSMLVDGPRVFFGEIVDEARAASRA